MEPTYDGTVVHANEQAREQFYDARGYGTPRDGRLELAPVEAAHLLYRGDITAIRDDRDAADRAGDGADTIFDFNDFLVSNAVSEVAFFVYADLRERGFYLSPVGGQAASDDQPASDARRFVVYPRGDGPWDDRVAYEVLAVSEREDVSAATLTNLARPGVGADEADGDDGAVGTLAVVDEESEVTYLSVGQPTMHGSSADDVPTVAGRLLSDRVLVPDPPDGLYQRAFYGQRFDRDGAAVQLSLVEAAYLAGTDRLTLSGEPGELESGESVDESDTFSDGVDSALRALGRSVEGERFDRRVRVYSALRTAGLVPKTGYKFGADFRTYADVESVEDLGHSDLLVRVRPAATAFSPRDLALDVRLAHGVRKQMVYALVGDDDITWIGVERLTP